MLEIDPDPIADKLIFSGGRHRVEGEQNLRRRYALPLQRAEKLCDRTSS